MKRRGFLQTILGIAGSTALPASSQTIDHPTRQTLPDTPPLILLETAIAGFQYYEGERVFNQIKIGDTVDLRRAPSNRYDKRAVELYWNGNMLGHLPRTGNMGISQMMDRGQHISSTITRLMKSNNPWDRVEIAVTIQTPTPSGTLM